jgi:glycosyltransferase involved in cell wall biosynthesis
MQRAHCKWLMSFATLGEYRLPAITQLQERTGRVLCVYAGTTAYDPSVRVLTPASLTFTPLKNRYIRGDILFQNIPWRRYVASECLLLDLNPRVPHIWMLLAVRRLLRRRTILWGHAWPRSGYQSRSEAIRRRMRALSSGVVTYTHSQAVELRKVQPALRVFVAPNALYLRSQMAFDCASERFRVLYVGRLAKEKKPELLLEAFELCAPSLPQARLTFVGDGPLMAKLESRIAASPLRNRIEVLGHVSHVEALRSLYREAVVSVSPGCVGLSATQSFGFGVPMLISPNEPHGPEIEAAHTDENCVHFETDNAEALGAALKDVWRNKSLWAQRGPGISAACAAAYSIERMVGGLIAALQGDPE